MFPVELKRVWHSLVLKERGSLLEIGVFAKFQQPFKVLWGFGKNWLLRSEYTTDSQSFYISFSCILPVPFSFC